MADYDLLSMRICMILVRLFLGETLSVVELADEFNVSTKTINRDFKNRLSSLPNLDIEKVKSGYYKLSKHHARALKSYKDILHFSRIIYIDRLFPKHAFDHKFIGSLLSNKAHSPCIIYTEHLDEQPNMYGPFLTIIKSIIDKALIIVRTKNETLNNFAPYQLIHYKRHWYLVGEFDKHILVIAYESIQQVEISDCNFQFNLNLSKIIQEEKFFHSLPHFNYTSQLVYEFQNQKR